MENLSWRLWNRETFCCAPGEANATTPAISISQRSSDGRYSSDIPELSNSIGSLDDEAIESDNEESASTSAPLNILRPKVQRQDSGSNRSRGRERHITPDDLEKMVITIKEKKDLEPLDMSNYSYLAPLAAKKPSPKPATVAEPIISRPETKASATPTSNNSMRSSMTGSSTTNPSEHSATSVVRGFSPSQVSSSYRSIPLNTAPSSLPKSALASNTRLQKTKKHAMFALGASSQSDNDSFQESSMESHMQQSKLNQAQKKKGGFMLGGSSGDDSSLRSNMKQARSSLSRPAPQKKTTSFKEEIAAQGAAQAIMNSDVFSDTEDEDESAIDDDDDSDEWEDSMEESGKSSLADNTLSFPRVDSRPTLTSRRSLITAQLHQGDRAAHLLRAATRSSPALAHRSRNSSPQGPSMPPSEDDVEDKPVTMAGRLNRGAANDVPRSGAQPIIVTTTNSTPHQAALSPRTTRRQMLATELTPSLRRNLLWERQQKNQTASAVLKRRHTAHDVAHLKQYPERPHMGSDAQNDHGSYNQYFGQGLGEYHTKGW